MSETEKPITFEERLQNFIRSFGTKMEWTEDQDFSIVQFNTVENPAQAQTLIEEIKKIFAVKEMPVEVFDWSVQEEEISGFLLKIKSLSFFKKPILIFDFTKGKKEEKNYGESLLNNREALMSFLGGIIIINLPKDKARLRSLLPDIFTKREFGINSD